MDGTGIRERTSAGEGISEHVAGVKNPRIPESGRIADSIMKVTHPGPYHLVIDVNGYNCRVKSTGLNIYADNVAKGRCRMTHSKEIAHQHLNNQFCESESFHICIKFRGPVFRYTCEKQQAQTIPASLAFQARAKEYRLTSAARLTPSFCKRDWVGRCSRLNAGHWFDSPRRSADA